MRHNPVNKCIYCEELDNLTDEHIFAYGLGGDEILPKASCQECAKITGSIERHVLRGLWWFIRAVLNYPTRRPKDMPTTFSLKVVTKNNEEKDIVLADEDRIALSGFVEYEPPAFLQQTEFKPGIPITGLRIIGFGTAIEDLVAKYNIKSITGTINYKGTTFARMLAKIALGVAVARFGLDSFEEIFVRDSILNKIDDVGRWVGGDPWPVSEEQLEIEGQVRNVASVAVDDKRIVLVRIRLFSFSEHVPAYIVIVGRLKPNVEIRKENTSERSFLRTFKLPAN